MNGLQPAHIHLTRSASTHDDRVRERILVWMKSTGIRQADVATAIGRTQPWLSRYLRGKLDADFETLNRIALVFGHTLAHLIDPPWRESQLIERYRTLTDADRARVEQFIDDLVAARGLRARGRKR